MDDIESVTHPTRRSSHRSKHSNSNNHDSKNHHKHRRSSKKKRHSKSSIKDLQDRKLERNFTSKRSSIGLASNDSSGNTNRNCSKQDINKQARELDESFRSYWYAESAARKIQLAFRERQEAKLNQEKSVALTEKGPEDVKKVDENENDDSNIYTSIFLLLFAIVMCLPKILGMLKGVVNGQDTGDLDAAANTALQPGGGGGAGGPAPVGGESAAAGSGAQAGAQGAMATQAASSVASGAASGVTAGATVGAAATSAAAAATAGATAAAAGATQVATVVVVSTAAMAAITTGVAVSVTPTAEPILSKCGLLNPDVRIGRFSMSFEGFPRTLERRESNLVKDLVMDSYNEITIGPDVASIGCLDPLSRDMHSMFVVNQTLTNVVGFPVLEVLFEATVSCDRCSPSSPLFSDEQLAMQEDSNSQSITNETSADVSTGNETEAPIQDTVQDKRFRKLQGISFDSQEFFQKLIQLVIFETEELTDVGELPQGFEKISKAWVVTNDEEEKEVLVTEVQYERKVAVNGSTGDGGSTGGGSGGSNSNGGGSGGSSGNGGGRDAVAVLQFSFVDEEGEVQKVTVEVTEEGEAVPTTAFPTFQPSYQPSHRPSSEPTNFFSGQPTMLPSKSPSNIPTIVFSGQPTTLPSKSPSNIPSLSPSQSPSERPSIIPSDSPSLLPSVSPSESPSAVPSMQPSAAPSESPSIVPSFVPSMVPSTTPSFVPSMVPSFVPSESPSMVPSFVPSESPSMVPSFIPSTVPSFIPSMVPSFIPSMLPTVATPSPTSSPTQLYLGCFDDAQPRAMSAGGDPALRDMIGMTIDKCRTHCRNNGFKYAGLQVGSECYCDNSYDLYGATTGCVHGCSGSAGEECGFDWKLSVYSSGL